MVAWIARDRGAHRALSQLAEAGVRASRTVSFPPAARKADFRLGTYINK